MRLSRRHAVALGFALATGAFTGRARADKGACFDAAEQAQLSRYHDDLVGAREKLMVCARSDCPPTVARDCAQWLGEVTQSLPSLAIHAQDPRGHDVIGASVLIDGHRVAAQLGGTAVFINPGAHHVRLETPSGVVYEEEILVVEGQKDRVLEARFPAPLNLDGTRAQERSASVAAARGGHGLDALSLAIAVVGVSSLALATYFEVSGQSEYGTLQSGCGASGTCSQGAVDESKQKLYVDAPVAFGAGLLSLGVAVGVFLFGRHEPSSRAPSAAWQLGVMPLAGNGGGGVLGAAGHSF